MTKLNKVYCMDCLEGMRQLEDDSVDLIITDPPYGDNCGYGRNGKEIAGNEHPLLNLQVLFESQRILKNNCVIYNFTNWKHYPFLTEFILRYTCFNIRMMIVLNKNRFGLGYGFRNKHELVLVLEKGKPVYNKNDFSNVLDFRVFEHDVNSHPHEKPKNIIRRMIEHSSKDGDLVLDPFAGGGNILVACKELNRRFLGFEIEEKWCFLANKKLLQKQLFDLNGYGGVEDEFKERNIECDR